MFLCSLLLVALFFENGSLGAIDFLIIGPEETREISRNFVDYKRKIGFSSAFVSVEEINSFFDGIDLQEKIRNSLKYFNQNFGLRYVLLLGDYNKFPSRIATIVFSGNDISNNVPTDFYYSELFSNWDKNRNGFYGERADSISLTPSLLVGRVPYHSLSELEGYFEKVMRYKELTAKTNKVLLHSSDFYRSGSSYLQVDTLQAAFPRYFNISKLYERGDVTPRDTVTIQRFVDSVNADPLYVFSSVHGDFGGMYINEVSRIYFGINDLRRFQTITPAIWGILSCDVGGFDRDAFGEHLIFKPNCIGLLTQSRDGLPSMIKLYYVFFESLFLRDDINIGEADSIMRKTFENEGYNYLSYYYTLLNTNLFGDPTLIPVKGDFFSYEISSLTFFEDTSMLVKVRLAEDSVNRFYTQVTKRFVLYKPEEFIKVIETKEDSVMFNFRVSSPGYLYVTLTGPRVRDVFDSVYVKPYSLPVNLSIDSFRNEFGDTILIANSLFLMTINVTNTSSKELERFDLKIRGTRDFTIFDSVFTLSLKPFESKKVRIRGFAEKVDSDTVGEITLLMQNDRVSYIRSWKFNVFKANLEISDFKVCRKQDYYLVQLNLFNPNKFSVKDIKIRSKAFGPDLYDHHITLILPERDTTIIDSIPLSRNELYFTIYYLNDTLVVKESPGIVVLPPPNNVTGTPGPGFVKVQWREPFRGLLYNVYKSEDGINFIRLNRSPIDGVSYTVYEVSGPTYFYVTSLDTIKMVESVPSELRIFYPNPSFLDGWPQPAIGTGYSSPVICEFDIVRHGKEILIGTFFDSLVYAFDSRGNLLPGFPINLHGAMLGSPAAGDLDGDGEDEVVITTFSGSRSLFILDRYGVVNSVYLPGSGYNTPAIFDLNGDGINEIITRDGNFLKIISPNGSVIASSQSLGGGNTSPAVGDIDGDGFPEILFSFTTSSSGYLVAFRFDSALITVLTSQINKNNITSPSIGEIAEDFEGLEIVVGAGDSLYLISSYGQIIARGYTSTLTSWPFAISPAIGDVDGDGVKEIVVPVSNGFRVFKRIQNSLVSILYVPCGGGFSSCVLYDVDDDGMCEIFKGGVDGLLHAYRSDGSLLGGFPIDLFSYVYPTPQIDDVDGNGLYDIIASSWANSVFIFSTNWTIDASSFWAMYKHDKQRTGNAEQNWPGNSTTLEREIKNDAGISFENTKISLYDINGRLIFRGSKTDFEQRIFKGTFQKGIYFVFTEGNFKNNVKKLVIIR